MTNHFLRVRRRLQVPESFQENLPDRRESGGSQKNISANLYRVQAIQALNYGLLEVEEPTKEKQNAGSTGSFSGEANCLDGPNRMQGGHEVSNEANCQVGVCSSLRMGSVLELQTCTI